MNKVFFISDLHFGHKRILEFAGEYRGGHTIQEHDDWLVDAWNSVVTKRDVVYVLGDIAFSREGLERCADLCGIKKAILGNHDKFAIEEYQKYFRLLPGIFRYKDYWLTHAPIHPAELRGKKNIHGHVHHNTIPDDNYINVCVEPLLGRPIWLEDIRMRTNREINP